MGNKIIQEWQIPSSNKDSEPYTVVEFDDGSMECTCTAWTYRQDICRHIRRAKLCKTHPELEKITLQLINGQVTEVKLQGKKAVIPLLSKPIPFNALMTMMHDLLELGIPMKKIKKFFKGNGVSKLMISDVYDWISTNKRIKVKPLKVLSSFL